MHSPRTDPPCPGLGELVDMAEVQKMVEAHYAAAAMPNGIIDARDGTVLAGAGWQDICTLYHRANPATLARCRESDLAITGRLKPGKAHAYKCRNGLWDIGIPIMTRGRHLATLFLGQFFYEGEDADTAFFVRQAEEFGFDKAAYLDAVARVPVFSRAKVENILAYNTALAGFLGRSAEHALDLRERLEDSCRARQALQESEQKFRAIADYTFDWESWLDNDGRLLWVNPAVERIAGRSPAECMAMADYPLPMVHPEHRETVRNAITQGLSGEPGNNVPFQIVHATGGMRWVAISWNPIRADGGARDGLRTSIRDIDERKRAVEAMQESEKRYRRIVETTSEGVWTMDAAHRTTYVNEVMARMLGYTPGEMLGRKVEEFFFPEDLGQHSAEMGRRHAGKSGRYERRFRRKDGGEVWTLVSGTPILDADGAFSGSFGMFADITERRRAEDALRRAEALMRTMLMNLPLDFWARDLAGRVIIQSDICRSFWGNLDREPRAENHIPAETLARWEANNARALSGEAVTGEAEYLLPSGERVHYHEIVTPIRDRGEVLGIMGVNVDLTDRCRMEEKLRASMATAEAANRAKGEFLANMSHELRTPLNGVLGMLQLLDNSAGIANDDKVLLETAMESGRGLLAIINDILSFAQYDAGKLAVAREPVDLREIVDSLCRAFRFEIEERGLALEAAVDDSMPGQVLSDAGRLRQILLNLLTNALKFTNEGRVEVAVCALPLSPSPADRMLLVTVSDTGIGIPDDKLDVIFEPFTQVDGSLTRKYKGTGIGLGIVRQLARLMGGSVCVDSAVGAGTAFYVTIRCGWSLPDPAAEAVPLAAQAAALQGLRVLVAEDDRVNRFTATRFLERLGCSAKGAGDGRAAVALLEREDFDCILMDVQMPEMDGMEATRAIRSSAALGPKARIPIIAMTAHAMPGDREQFLAAGMDGYLAKPVDMAELESVLAGIAARKQDLST